MIDLLKNLIEQLWHIQRQVTPEIIALAEQGREGYVVVCWVSGGLALFGLLLSVFLFWRLMKSNKETSWACGMDYTGEEKKTIFKAGERREMYVGAIFVVCAMFTLSCLIIFGFNLFKAVAPLPHYLGF